MFALALTAAIVVGDDVALRASPARDAAKQASLWRGDWLEVRGERKGWLEVYDHRHERPGWIAPAYVRVHPLEADQAPALRGVIEFLRDAPGSESLGIAYAALYMRVAPASSLDSELFTALGTMAERLARRASSPGTGRSEATVSAHLEVAESWGVRFASVVVDGETRICYDGEAFRHVMTLDEDVSDVARAALALTDGDCVSPTLGLTERQASDEARLSLIEKIDPTQAPGWLANRIRIRRAEIAASLAWTQARRGDAAASRRSATAAVEAFLRVDQTELADEDVAAHQGAALAVAASQWGAADPPKRSGTTGPTLATRAGDEGETCLTVAKTEVDCTHGHVWVASFRVAPDGASAALAVGPLPGWSELWLFRRVDDGGWIVDVLPPTTEGVDRGYVELAGWSPDGKRALIVREAREAGVVRRAFQIVNLSTLEIERETRTFAGLGKAKGWATSEWRGRSLSLR